MGSQGPGRKRTTSKVGLTAEEDALNIIAREAEARLAAKRSARVEAREIRMKELERQQKEIYQVQKKYYGLDKPDNKWGAIEQWMEDSEWYTRLSQRHALVSDDEERMSVGSRSNIQVNDRLEQDYLEKGSSRASTISGATLTSLGEMSSRRGSGDTSITVDTEPSIREIKDVLLEVEEKYRKAMVSNAQLDNEKTNLIYEVDTLKDSLIELEEMLFETRHDLEDKNKNLEREKHAHSILQFQFNELKVTLKQSEELLTEIRQLRLKQDGSIREISDLQETIEWKNKKIGALERQKEFSDAIRNERDELRDEVIQLKDILKKHGIVLGPDLATNGETGEQAGEADQNSQTSPVEIRERSSVLEIRLRKLVDERENLIEQVKRFKGQLEQRKQRNSIEDSSSPEGDVQENGTDSNIMAIQRDANRQINDLKFKLVKSEQEITAHEQNATRLESQVSRYKVATENAEKVEDELKAEKRKLQRELRSAMDKIEELEDSNSHLSKRFEKIKSGRVTATP
ncbi:leucine-rich repeat flightless-interacting protein 2-like isoform X14 [Xyrauchen texanus]|uniref:leucine-rich repeat flightless-interacting protein 2-like isoform X14 n=1 Tax=Xyrauchen texanus TaxID=154827 RepID=UPI0022420E82|nr:leucine-rich repeat flightless-interacting protein 2-like isoform X14 [Xyrauchen texanus]